MLQPTNPSIRELLNHFVKSFKPESKDPYPSIEIANAKLSPFEKTYVSFPEFIDIQNESEPNRPLYNNDSWHQQTLSC
ncbi:hypothetical protein INT47_004994 [Mucor saturninus]|uniref:Uncharacterized protein n=1 Tax=Mucor saturninus TaxID=64648 RepID=A0A8H7QTB8_9FUNG|nr:hypothetical protein INT47_004994 [Mucor saturninus]